MNTGSPCDIVHHESACSPSVVTSCNSSIKKVRCENKWLVQQHNLLEIYFFFSLFNLQIISILKHFSAFNKFSGHQQFGFFFVQDTLHLHRSFTKML